MQTTYHTYKFDVGNADEARAYGELCKTLRATPGRGHWMHCLADARSKDLHADGEFVTLETKFLFNNQWNTDKARVFDWYEGIYTNRNLKHGHYLDITDAMREIRRNTNVCGFCGHQERAENGLVFCDRCLDSPYLEKKDLPLLRMCAVDVHHTRGHTRAPLTDAELAYLLPLYTKRQTEGDDSRNAAKLREQRARIINNYEAASKNARIKRDGLLWLMDHDVSLDNVIYYSHTQRFGFGWRKPVSAEVKSVLLDVLCEFPFDYDIKA